MSSIWCACWPIIHCLKPQKNQLYTPLSIALHYYEAAGWEIRIFSMPVVFSIRGLMDTRHIQEAFAFLTIPRKVWYIGIERFVIASVKAFSFLHQIRYSSCPSSWNRFSWRYTTLSDPEIDSENMAASQSEDSADKDMLDTTTRIRKHAHAQTISSETNTASSKKNSRTCPAPCPGQWNTKKKEKVSKYVSTKACRSSISSPASTLAVVSKVTRNKQYRSQARKSCRKRSNVSNVVQSKLRLCKQTRAVPNATRQLRPRSFKVDDLQYKTFDTNDPNHLINTVQWYPLDMIRRNWLNGNNWSATDEERHNLPRSL